MNEKRWTAEQANEWYRRQPWLVGCNFTPSTAINQLEMWQADTFDLPTIARELTWAASLGFNTVRVYLHDLLWDADRDGFRERIACYLNEAAQHGIRTLFVLFDDCWNKTFAIGPQPQPVPGVHNSGWVQSPGKKVVLDPAAWGRLESYVKGVLAAFAADDRVLGWDLYNEPGNSDLREKSLPLLRKAFEWGREVAPRQPLTSGVWSDVEAVRRFQIVASDLITFHDYENAEHLVQQIRALRRYGRPLLCTEYMARTRGSLFLTHLPIFKAEGVGCLNWGLVSGKTQTIYPWGSPEGAGEPPVWFHDIFRADGRPYDAAEAALIRSMTGTGA